MALATTSKGTSTISVYFANMKSLADEMAAAGCRLEDEELVSYVLATGQSVLREFHHPGESQQQHQLVPWRTW
jgi:hypothetical protein